MITRFGDHLLFQISFFLMIRVCVFFYALIDAAYVYRIIIRLRDILL